MKKAFLFACTVLLFSCGNDPKDGNKKQEESNTNGSLLTLLLSDKTGVDFKNELTATMDNNILNYEYYYNGGGVAVGDINNDGLADIFFTGTNVDNKLYLNKGKLRFEDISKKAGIEKHQALATGVTMVDINNDGWLDIYVCQSGKFDKEKRANLLYINNKNNTFTESAKAYGLNDMSYSTQASFFDFDRDGDLDLFLVNHPIDFEYSNTLIQRPDNQREFVSERLYVNNGNNTFTDVTEKAGVSSKAFGLSVAIADINADGWPDVYVGNDYMQPDFLFINNRNGTFTESFSSYFRHCSNSTMGSDIADYNNDGLLDIITLDMIPETNKRQKNLKGPMTYDAYQLMVKSGFNHQYMRNMLQLNNGNGSFSEIGQLAGVSNTDWSWNPMFVDLDNDGWKDLFITNGFRRDITNLDYSRYYLDSIIKSSGKKTMETVVKALQQVPSNKIQNYVYRNNGDLTFTRKNEEWNFTEPTFSNGAAYVDLDNDGDQEIVINNIDMPAFIFKNNSREAQHTHYLDLSFRDESGKNQQGIGASARLSMKGKMQYAVNIPTRGFESAVENKLHFGLGPDSLVEELEITWPDGAVQRLKNVSADKLLVLNRKDAHEQPAPAKPVTPLFTEAAGSMGLDFVHRENDFIDFKREPLLPQKFSEFGPCLAAGDINGDGTEDVFAGAATGQTAALFTQGKDGHFTRKPCPALDADKICEDGAALFFDADRDGDNDLYVSSAGNEFEAGSKNYQARLYINDGKGNFVKSKDALPVMNTSSCCVAAGDYDGDGDLDLFTGGRIISGKYPLAPRSYVLQNNNGKFSDVTESVCKDLVSPGLVCDAVWADFNNDKALDLVVVGQWMEISFFKNTGKTFQKSSLENSGGWWNCITACDIDKDGDMDFVAGNLGWNSRIKASEAKPAAVFANDFDENGSTDAVMSIFFGDKSYPIHQRDQLLDQVRELRKKYLRYDPYSNATLLDIFPKEKIEKSLILLSKNFSTSLLENLGNGSFRISPLPVQAQFAPVNGIVCSDFNGDGNTDILLAGNCYGPEIETGRYDAGTGLLLTGNGKSTFTPLRITESGFFAGRNAQNLLDVKSARTGKPLILVGNNNDRLQVFEKK